MGFAVYFIANNIEGIYVNDLRTAFVVALVLGLINTFIRPIINFLALPIHFLTLGFSLLLVNTLLFWVTGLIVKSFEVHGIFAAFVGSLILTLVNMAADLVLKLLR
jgi:putative membrane protein